MRLPSDYQIPSLSDLKRVVALIATGAEKWNEQLKMTSEQYGRYKELVWRENAMLYFLGMKIQIEPPIKNGLVGKLSTEEPTKTGDGSV